MEESKKIKYIPRKRGKTQKKTTEEYKHDLYEKHNGKIICKGEYVNNSTKILHYCTKHSYEYMSTPNCVLTSKHGCPLCGEEALKSHTDSLRVYDNENYRQLLDEKFGGNIVCLEDIQASNTSIKHFCKIHQYEYKSSPARILLNQYGCKYCSADARTQSDEERLENVKNRIYELVGDEYEIVGGFTAVENVANFKHNHPNGETHYFDMTPSSFIYRGSRCYCENPSVNKLIVGFNDIATTRPDIAKCLHNKEYAFKYTMHHKEKLEWDCPECGNTFKEAPCNVAYNRLSCPYCSDGISYPNKFIFNSLSQIEDDLDFLEREYRPEWCKFNFNDRERQGIYDTYFAINGKQYVVEMDGGIGHGNKAHTNSEYSQEELYQIDIIKDKLANKQGIQVIRIDCNYKTDDKYTYILNNILNSELKDVVDLSKIDFDLSNKTSVNSLIVKAGKLWNEGLTAGEIRKYLKIGEGTVTSYLKTASNIGVCDYTVQKSQARSRYVKVYCITTNKIFESMTQAAKMYGTNRSGIKRCCEGIATYSGVFEGKELHWKYYNDYLKSTTPLGVSA